MPTERRKIQVLKLNTASAFHFLKGTDFSIVTKTELLKLMPVSECC